MPCQEGVGKYNRFKRRRVDIGCLQKVIQAVGFNGILIKLSICSFRYKGLLKDPMYMEVSKSTSFGGVDQGRAEME